LLNLHYRVDERDLTMPRSALAEQAVGHMYAILSLGEELARRFSQGVPFEPLSMGYEFGYDRQSTVIILDSLLQESQKWTEDLVRDSLIPADYPAAVDSGTRGENKKWLAR
jgi:hypothetical protein